MTKQSPRTKGSVAFLKECIQFGCVSQDYPQRKSILREVGKLGSNHTVKFSKGTWHHVKIRERKDPSYGVMQKCESQERIPWAPNLRTEHKTKPWNKKDTPAEKHGTSRKMSTSSKKKEKVTFQSLAETCAMPTPSPKKSEEREFVVDSAASTRMLSRKELSSGELETFSKVQEAPQ